MNTHELVMRRAIKTVEKYERSLSEKGIPAYMHTAVIGYVLHGWHPGDFLHAVISNNLTEAAGHADAINQPLLWNYCNWFYNHAPADCWGSADSFARWQQLRTRPIPANVRVTYSDINEDLK